MDNKTFYFFCCLCLLLCKNCFNKIINKAHWVQDHCRQNFDQHTPATCTFGVEASAMIRSSERWEESTTSSQSSSSDINAVGETLHCLQMIPVNDSHHDTACYRVVEMQHISVEHHPTKFMAPANIYIYL